MTNYLLHNIQTVYYDGIDGNGGIVQACQCRFQPNPGYGFDNCYLKSTMAEEAHLDCFQELPEEIIVLGMGLTLRKWGKRLKNG